jgi:hypothetical protein
LGLDIYEAKSSQPYEFSPPASRQKHLFQLIAQHVTAESFLGKFSCCFAGPDHPRLIIKKAS